jgi:mRNA-degrading endonuclease toxin of MazEF toxin-antitoxin module
MAIGQSNGHAHGTTLTSTPTPPTRERVEGGVNVEKSLRNAVKLMENVESTTQCCKRSRLGVMDDEKATKLKGTLTSVSSSSSAQSSRVGRLSYSSIGTSLKRAPCVNAKPLGVPYVLTIIFRLASVHFRRASSGAVQEDIMWSRLPHALHLFGRPRPPRGPRGWWPRPLCGPRLALTNAEMGGGDVSGAGMLKAPAFSSIFCAMWRTLAITSSADMR